MKRNNNTQFDLRKNKSLICIKTKVMLDFLSVVYYNCLMYAEYDYYLCLLGGLL